MNEQYRYNHLKNGYSDFLFKSLYKLRHELPKGKVIDVGCGHGRNLSLLKKLGYDDLVGIDILDRTAEIPEYIDFIKFNIEDGVPAETLSADITLYNYVHMFLKEDAQNFVVEELLRVTSDLLIIETYKPKHQAKYFHPFRMSDIKNVILKNPDFKIITYREKTGKIIARRKMDTKKDLVK